MHIPAVNLERLLTYQLPHELPTEGNSQERHITEVAVSSNKQLIAALIRDNGKLSLCVWARSGKIIAIRGHIREPGFIEKGGLSFWPDDNHVLTVGSNFGADNLFENFKLWHIYSNSLSFPFNDEFHEVYVFKVSSSGRFIIFDGKSKQGHGIHLFDAWTKEVQLVPCSARSDFPGFFSTFSPDETRIAMGELQHISILDLKGNKIIQIENLSIEGSFASCSALAPGNEVLVTGSGIWSINSAERLVDDFPLLKKTKEITSACYSKDGYLLITGQKNGSLCFWNTGAYELIFEREHAHQTSVERIVLNDKDNELFTADESSIILWQLKIN